AVIGPIESNAKRIGFMGLANKIAGLVSLALLGSAFLADADGVIERVANASSAAKDTILAAYISEAVVPYLIITGVLFVLAAMIYYSQLPEVDESTATPFDTGEQQKKSVFQFPNLVFGVIALFFSAACEVIPI